MHRVEMTVYAVHYSGMKWFGDRIVTAGAAGGGVFRSRGWGVKQADF